MRSRPTEPRRRGASAWFDALLVVAAAVGLLVLVARLAGAVLGLQLVTFATGSMAPEFPQRSLAITAHVPLTAVRIGDVVTIDRVGRLPITHRVVAIAVDGDGGSAVVRLRGDANRRADPAPYRVAALARVVAPLPAALTPVGLLATPQAGAAGAALAAVAVGWALWPRRRASAPREALPS